MARIKARNAFNTLTQQASRALGGVDQMGNPIKVEPMRVMQTFRYDPDVAGAGFISKGQFFTPGGYLRKVKSLEQLGQSFPFSGGKYYIQIKTSTTVTKPVPATAQVTVSASIRDNLYRGLYARESKDSRISEKDYLAAIEKIHSTIKSTLAGTDSLGNPISVNPYFTGLQMPGQRIEHLGTYVAVGQFTPQEAIRYIVKAKKLNDLSIARQTEEGLARVTVTVSYVDGNSKK